MKEKSILFFTESLGSGGAERQLCGLSIMLKNRGYRVKVVTYLEAQFYEPLLQNAGVDYELREDLLPKFSRILGFVKIAKKFKPNVVIAFLPSTGKTACIAKLFCNYKLIIGERNANISLTNSDKIKFNIFRLANAIVPNSFFQGEFIATHFPWLKPRIHPIVNFVDVQKFKPTFKCKHNNTFTIITAARYTSQKNYLNYAEAIAIAKQKGYKFHCDWYGGMYHKEYINSLEVKIKELGIEDYITLSGPISEIEKKYQEADALCLPSIYEGYPNVLCEAMSCGLPVICSNVVEMPRIVTEGENGYLFDPYKPESIAEAIIKLINTSKMKLSVMGKLNRQKILRDNTEYPFVQKYIQLIDKL